jgi:hypothetical protein
MLIKVVNHWEAEKEKEWGETERERKEKILLSFNTY